MSEALIAKKSPYAVQLEAGTYWWCRCGRSANQPFCDGSHKTTDFTPVKLVLDEPKKVALCGCKRTNDSPYCDGTHEKIN